MKEIVKNKMILAVTAFIFGALYLNSININSEIKMAESENKVIAFNK